MSKTKAGIPYHDWEVGHLAKNKSLAIDYLRDAFESLDDPNERGAALLSIRAVAEAFGGIGKIAAEAGISRESLYRSLSSKGNPTLKTLIAVLNVLGLRLTAVESEVKKSRRRVAA